MPQTNPRALGLAAVLALLGAGAAWSEDRAVVVANGSYAQLPDLPGSDLSAAISAFKAAGFRVVEGANLRASDLRAAASDLLRPDATPRQRVIVLAGRFVHSRADTWMLGQDAARETIVSVGQTGLPLSVLAELIEGTSGDAILFLASDDRAFDTAGGLQPGIGAVPARPGVTVVSGTPQTVARAAVVMARPGGSLAQALAQGGLTVLAGRAPAAVPGSAPVVVADPDQPRLLDDVARPGQDEQLAWTRAKRANSVDGYREFLQKYPSSLFAGAARGRMEELDADLAAPRTAGPAAAEAALGLSRAQQAQIQRQLSLLTYDTAGIDGTFGPATRAAIARFQRDTGQTVTGYLTRQLIDDLAQSAAERGRALEAEAARRQAAAEAADDQFWAGQQPSGPEGARRYLARYPDGRHAEAAQQVLTRAANGASAEEIMWQRVRAADRGFAYREYLEKYPASRHAAEARERLAGFERQWAADQATEARLDLSDPVKLVIEQRLAALGLDVGTADGRFDMQTRGAIRQYQESRNLRPSGFMNQGTAVRLLADTLLAQD